MAGSRARARARVDEGSEIVFRIHSRNIDLETSRVPLANTARKRFARAFFFFFSPSFYRLPYYRSSLFPANIHSFSGVRKKRQHEALITVVIVTGASLHDSIFAAR